MPLAAPPFWYQGLFLQPHHFQQEEQFLLGSILPRLGWLKPFFWGVRDLQVREAALADQVLEITRGAFLFRDGTFAVLPDTAALPARSFRKTWTETDRPLKAFVGIPRMQERPNVTLVDASTDPTEVGTRYLCPMDPKVVKDLHGEGPEASLRIMAHALRIYWEDEVPSLVDHELIPVAVVESNRGVFRLAPTFAPPAVQVGDIPILLQILRELRDQASSTGRLLEDYKGGQEGGESSAYFGSMAALRLLARYIPLLHGHAACPALHPWELDLLLRQFVGELSTFTPRVNVLGALPEGRALARDYAHEDPLPSFIDLQTLIAELLGGLLVGPSHIIDMIREGSSFLATMPLEVSESAGDIYLMVRTAAPGKTGLAESLAQIAKLGTRDRVQSLVARALSGVPLERRTVPPPGLPKHPDALHFKVETHDPLWQEIRRTQSVCLYWDQAPEDTTIEIVVLHK
jgi:type VI secretion system protein ImpJ